jgi:hypothetical protein
MSPIIEAMKPSPNSDRQSCASLGELFPKNGTAFVTESPTTFVSSRPTIFGSSRRPGIAGNSQAETGSIRAASTTTQSSATGDFLKMYERPRIGGDRCDGSFSEMASLLSAGRSCAFFSGPEIPFPGNRDRERQRLGSSAGYAEGRPSIWCCRDHSAGMSARRATPMP